MSGWLVIHRALFLLILVAAIGPCVANAQEPPTDALESELDRRLIEDVKPLLATYCLSCHSAEKTRGFVRFDTLSSMKDAMELAEDLEVAMEMIQTHQMPPKESPQPTDHERLILAQWLETAVSYVPLNAAPDPGWFTIHRLNRAEYRNTVGELLGIDADELNVSERLPRDDTGYGFDNIADVLSVSPHLIEQYLDAAERAIAFALGPVVDTQAGPQEVSRLRGEGHGSPLPGGGFFMYSQGAAKAEFEFPVTGEYRIKLEAWETHAGDENAQLALRIDDKRVDSFQIAGTKEEPQHVETKIRVKAGRRTISAHFTNDFYVPKGGDRNVAVEWMTVEGPLDEASTERPAAWRALFGTRTGDEAGDAKSILSAFATRAFRRPLTSDESTALANFYDQERRSGASFEVAVRSGLTAVLVSPSFLYRSIENPDSEDPGAIYSLGPYELASRLSYFLWSSMPDDELLALAASGEILDPNVISRQVRRMIADPRIDSFIENFSGQWLQLRALEFIAMDTSKYPEFDEAMKRSMQREAQTFFADVLRNDRSIVNFVQSDFMYVNEKLAWLYGVAGITGDEMQRVAIDPGSPRGGVITMGAVLTLTSNPSRTSPVKRGLYVLDQILGAPPPPPPADIPPLEQSHGETESMTLREQLALHVANPSCAVCHNRLDPIGLALENFSAMGQWRDQDAGKAIDASGTLPGGESFRGPVELKRVVLAKSDQFVESLCSKVLTYAIGRGMEPFDRPTIREIATKTRANEDRFVSLIEAVVLSDTFRTCRGRESEEETSEE